MHGTQLMSGGDKSTPPETSRSGRAVPLPAPRFQLVVSWCARLVLQTSSLSRAGPVLRNTLWPGTLLLSFFLLPLAWTRLWDRNRSTQKGALIRDAAGATLVRCKTRPVIELLAGKGPESSLRAFINTRRGGARKDNAGIRNATTQVGVF
jgi:hypothetical protein